MKLTEKKVHAIFLKCLFQNDEKVENPIIVESILLKVGFNPQRIKERESFIEGLLKELPNEFISGGGWSFLYMCTDKDKKQWTDYHRLMDELVALGIAIGKISFLMPRDMWGSLPGGMPYLVVNFN